MLLSPGLITVIVIAVLVLILIYASIRILREYERGVVFTLGRYTGTKGPGLFLLVPFVQQMVRVDLRVIVDEVPPQAAWRYSPRSAAPQCLSAAFRFDDRSAKLFDEFMSNLQTGKAPAIIELPFLQNCTSVSRLNMSCLVKLHNPAAQCGIQPAHTGGKLGDVGVLCFVPPRFIATIERHV